MEAAAGDFRQLLLSLFRPAGADIAAQRDGLSEMFRMWQRTVFDSSGDIGKFVCTASFDEPGRSAAGLEVVEIGPI